MDQLVGVSHECDYPPTAARIAQVTACEIHGAPVSSQQIDQWVTEKLANGGDLFTLDGPRLHELKPDLILTQKLCDVCAPAYGSVTALAQTLPGPPRVLNLEPSSLEDIFGNIQTVADALGIASAGERVVTGLRERVARVRRDAVQATLRPRVVVVEWLDPVFCSGHWTPQLVEIAGGQEMLGQAGKDSERKTWADVRQAGPEILVIACCGQSGERASQDWELVSAIPDIQALPAVRTGKVFVVDGNAYFSRPGPRIVDSLEILAEIIHPQIFAGRFPDRGSRQLD
jgi:iron complex transport system substrate-binding protein